MMGFLGPLLLYQEGPMEYKPAVYCKCNKKAPRWVSWRILNPGWYFSSSWFVLFDFCVKPNVQFLFDFCRLGDAISGNGMMVTAPPLL